MKGCQETVLGKQEIYAYAHPDYLEILEGIKVSVESEENYRWRMTAAQARIEVWRTQEYSKRSEIKNPGFVPGFLGLLKLVSTHFIGIDLTGLQSIFWVLA